MNDYRRSWTVGGREYTTDDMPAVRGHDLMDIVELPTLAARSDEGVTMEFAGRVLMAVYATEPREIGVITLYWEHVPPTLKYLIVPEPRFVDGVVYTLTKEEAEPLDEPEKRGWVTFHELPQPAKRKTRRWKVTGSGGDYDVLGEIVWYGPWRQYIFKTIDGGLLLARSCLMEIDTFILQRMNEWRAR